MACEIIVEMEWERKGNPVAYLCQPNGLMDAFETHNGVGQLNRLVFFIVKVFLDRNEPPARPFANQVIKKG